MVLRLEREKSMKENETETQFVKAVRAAGGAAYKDVILLVKQIAMRTGT